MYQELSRLANIALMCMHDISYKGSNGQKDGNKLASFTELHLLAAAACVIHHQSFHDHGYGKL